MKTIVINDREITILQSRSGSWCWMEKGTSENLSGFESELAAEEDAFSHFSNLPTLCTKKKLDYKTFLLQQDKNSIAEGCILPSKQVALEWYGDNHTFNIYPDIESLQFIQSKQEGRSIYFAGFAPDGYHLTTFKVVRKEDVTGVSGEGIVAFGCYFRKGAVLQWNGDIPSIAYYPNGMKQIDHLHGHGGKTLVEEDISPSW